MRHTLALVGTCAVLIAAPAAVANEQCFATIEPPGGELHTVELTGFSVMGGIGPLDLPENLSHIRAITCRRASLVMSDRDYRVLTDLHLPFAFGDGDRVVWLYIEDMRLLMHMDEGVLSKEEREQIEGAIRRAQDVMLREGW